MALNIGMVTIDCANPQRLAEFWTAALGLEVLVDYGEYMVLGTPGSDGVSIGLQQVPEPRVGKNRLHLDLRGEPRAVAAERLVALGATLVEEHEMPGLSWTVLTDPEGNMFCVGEH